jgi:uncharacterized membrane protein YeaQ/YmgE (transglycosylase-associated protein family)
MVAGGAGNANQGGLFGRLPLGYPLRLQAELMFLFFSNRSGCLGSLVVSLIGTLILLVITGVIRLS